ncbi:MAG: VCBS repeat-containing protein, partial [Deltaproteobacteria bacterium]|nr:VCBS repeat-containing protein [Deltaproteobacteria bacterium]
TSVLFGNGDGTFQSAVSLAAGDLSFSVAVADLDGNDRLDLVTANLDGDDVTVLLNLCDPAADPEIDIKPRREVNRIHLMSSHLLRVAILGSGTFDVAHVDLTTLAFGPKGAPPAHRKGGHLEDVNRDGFDDLVSRYQITKTGIAFGDTQACVNGRLLDGVPFEGCDEIVSVPDCGIGFELILLLPPLMRLHARRRRSIPWSEGPREGPVGSKPKQIRRDETAGENLA